MTAPARKRIAIAILLLGGALLAVRAASLVGSDGDVVRPVVRPRASASVAVVADAAQGDAAAARLNLERLDARQQALNPQGQGAGHDKRPLAMFDAVSWKPPAPPAPPLAPPPKPVAPPFPYVYLGAMLDDGARSAFFSKGERVLVVKAGDTVDGVYRIDQMTDKQMQLTYLPLEQNLSVALGGGP
jgi:hypothetical protein